MTSRAAATLYSESGVKGIKIALDEINAKGGILGRKLDLVVRDTEAKVDVAVREVKDLILREKSQFLDWAMRRDRSCDAGGSSQNIRSCESLPLPIPRPKRSISSHRMLSQVGSKYLHGSHRCHPLPQ